MAARVAVVGPGLMGLGIVQVAAAAGCEVVLVGRDAEHAAAGRRRLQAALERQVTRGRLDAGRRDTMLARLSTTGDVLAVRGCTLAIESVAESRALKLDVLARLDAALPSDALLASNTSGLPITGLAAALQRPQRFIGLHFFSPVERMKLVEVVRGERTDDDTVARATAFVRSLGQTPVVVRDGPGFFTSRVFAAYLDEAVAMVGEGVPPARIEEAGIAAGRSIAPLALLDEISLALNRQQAKQAMDDALPLRFCRRLAWPVLDRLVALGRSGRAQGGGFYDHLPEGGRRLWAGLAEHFPVAADAPLPAVVQQRLRCAEAMEALRCLEEGVVASADDADTASLLGLAFPAATGGVLRRVESEGLDRFVRDADTLARAFGPRFEPSPWLRALAARGEGLARWRAPSAAGAAA